MYLSKQKKGEKIKRVNERNGVKKLRVVVIFVLLYEYIPYI